MPDFDCVLKVENNLKSHYFACFGLLSTSTFENERNWARVIVTLKKSVISLVHCTKMYPMALMCLSPLSPPAVASFPHVLESSGPPAVPNPILESQVTQSSSLFPRIPIRAALKRLNGNVHSTLKPSLLHLCCRDASDPISDFHVSRPSVVLRYCPSAIREWRESAFLLMTAKFVFSWPWIFIPRQILENDVFQ